MLPAVERSAEELNEALVRRIQSMNSDLMVLSGMTKRGAVLPKQYRELEALRRYFNRLVDALERGEPVSHPWDVEKPNAA
jgi:hypothetical protein